MRSQLGYTFTVLRWFVAITVIPTGIMMLRDGGEKWWLAPTLLLLGAGMVGLEIYLRRSRTTLLIQDSTIELLQRGVSLGSFPAEFVQYWTLGSRVRVLVKALLVSFVVFFLFGTVIFSTGDKPVGLALLSVGVIFAGAAIWEFRALWEIALPKPEAGYSTIELRKPGVAKAEVFTYASSTSVIFLRKPDVVKLLGFWPPDKRKSG